ncbi:MAG: DUF4012 domain-containing protein [Patescibacteria group bacterium]|jgi:hypothetical protein|nr:DUF4012 domain-containing protein [Patescibacteria group bacterium]
MRIVKYFLFSLLFLIFLFVAILIPSFNNFKAVYVSGMSAKLNLEESLNYLETNDFKQAKTSISQANTSFNLALENIEEVERRSVFKNISPLNNQLGEVKNLLESGEIASRSIERVLPIINSFKEPLSASKFVNLSKNDKEEILEIAFKSEPNLKAFSANLNLALLKLNRIEAKGVLFPISSEINSLKLNFNKGIKIVDKLPALSQIIPTLAGYPERSSYLIIMQNNDEIRPSGGFIGVFGLLHVESGEIESLSTYDSYHLDMPAYLSNDWQRKPPEVLEEYLRVEKWYLRDSNWSPNWPTSAQNILEIYNGEKEAIGEKSENFTGVIAINPNFVADLIELVGDIEARGDTYTKHNFQELLQYSVEMSYKEEDISSWDRKDIINEIVSKLKTRLFNLESEKMLEFLNIVEKHGENKNIQLFFTNHTINKLAIESGFGGEVKETNNDYLMVVDANLGAFKSDVVVKKNYEYSISLNEDKANSELHLNYKHNGGFDWRTTRYQSYTRVYVPIGSKLNDINSYGQVMIDTDSTTSYTDNDLNKTVFGFYFKLEPGSTGGIKIDYDLPQSIKTNPYKLFVQKQSGQRDIKFNLKLNSNQDIYQNSYLLSQDMEVVVE